MDWLDIACALCIFILGGIFGVIAGAMMKGGVE